MLGTHKEELSREFGMVLREMRLRRNLSQEALALEADVQRNFVSLIELGHNQPTITTLFKLCFALDVSPSALLGEVEARLQGRLTETSRDDS